MKDRKTGNKATEKNGSRPFVGVTWDCCKVYSRVYLNKSGTAYVGWCPRCARRVQLNLSPSGSRSRFFSVS